MSPAPEPPPEPTWAPPAPTYADSLASAAKGQVCLIYDFASLKTRFVTVQHDGLTSPGGDWTVISAGVEPNDDNGTTLDVQTNKVTVGSASFSVVDVGGAITQWLHDHDTELAGALVTRREGFVGVAEAQYPVTRWIFKDYSVSDRYGGGYTFELDNSLKRMQDSLFDSYGEGRFGVTADVGMTDTSLALDKDPGPGWPSTGMIAVVNRNTNWCEVVKYTGRSGASLTGLQRKQYGTIAQNPAVKDDTTVYLVWTKRGNPLDVMLELLLTSDTVGQNGTHDLGDGTGLGMDASLVDVAGIEAIRDAFWPVPTFDGTTGAKLTGTAVLFVEPKKIGNTLQWISENLLTPFALVPSIDAQERFTVQMMYNPSTHLAKVSKSIDQIAFQASKWSRNYNSRVNNLTLSADYGVDSGKPALSWTKTHATSVKRYGISKALEITNRGGRNGLNGFPDYGSDSDLTTAAIRILLELANPWTELEIDTFLAFKDVAVGDPVAVTISNIPDIARGTVGVTDAVHVVTQRKVSWTKGNVKFRIRLRRSVARAAFVCPNTVASTYTAASAADRQYCYVTPGDTGFFANGDEAYTVIET